MAYLVMWHTFNYYLESDFYIKNNIFSWKNNKSSFIKITILKVIFTKKTWIKGEIQILVRFSNSKNLKWNLTPSTRATLLLKMMIIVYQKIILFYINCMHMLLSLLGWIGMLIFFLNSSGLIFFSYEIKLCKCLWHEMKINI